MVDKNEMKLLEAFSFGEIEEGEFLRSFPVNLVENKDYLITLVNEAWKDKDEDDLTTLLDVIAMLDFYEGFDLQGVYRELLFENWHRMHEELIDSLDKKVENEGAFISVLNTEFEYYKGGEEDFMVPIWSKCLWSLYAIHSKSAIDEISKYQDSKFEYLRETSKKLMSKLENE